MIDTSKPLVWKEGLRAAPAKPRALGIPQTRWQKHQNTIHQKYIVEDLSLRRVVQYMKHHHDFFANERQYTTQFEKWGPVYVKRSSHRRPIPPSFPTPQTITDDTTSTEQGTPIEEDSGDVMLNNDMSEPTSASCAPEPQASVDTLGTTSAVGISPLLDATENHHPSMRRPSYSSSGPANSSSARDSVFTASNATRLSKPGTAAENRVDDEIKRVQSLNVEGNSICNDKVHHLGGPGPGSTHCVTDQTGELMSLAASAPYQLLSHSPNVSLEVPMQTLIIGERTECMVTLTQEPRNFSRILDSIFQNTYFDQRPHPVSEDEIQKLLRISDFLFAAQSYEDSFGITQVTRRLLGQIPIYKEAEKDHHGSSFWLCLAIKMVRSVTSTGNFNQIASFMKAIREYLSPFKDDKDYGLLYAYCGRACYQFASGTLAQRHKTTVSCWVKSRAVTTDIKYPLAPLITSSAIVNINQDDLIHFGTATRRVLQDMLQADYLEAQETLDRTELEKYIRLALHWCAAALKQEEFEFMVSNIDETFWTQKEHCDQTEIQQFEQVVVFSYLCDRSWHEGHLHCATASTEPPSVGATEAFGSISKHTGLTVEDILATIVNQLVDADSEASQPRRSTLPNRFRSMMETICRDEALKAAGYKRGPASVTVRKLVEAYTWPGRTNTIMNRFRNTGYAQTVRIFLREFLCVSLEVDLTARLQQYRDCLKTEQSYVVTTTVSQSARSSQLSEDFAAFRNTGRRSSQTTTVRSSGSLQVPSAMLSDTSSTRSLFRYSMSVTSLRSGDHMSVSGSSLRNSVTTSASETSENSGNRMSTSTGSLAGSSIVEAEEPDAIQERARRNARGVFWGARRLLNLSLSGNT